MSSKRKKLVMFYSLSTVTFKASGKIFFGKWIFSGFERFKEHNFPPSRGEEKLLSLEKLIKCTIFSFSIRYYSKSQKMREKILKMINSLVQYFMLKAKSINGLWRTFAI